MDTNLTKTAHNMEMTEKEIMEKYIAPAAAALAKDWDEGFMLVFDGKTDQLTERHKAALRMMPAVPFGDSMLCVRIPNA